MKKFIATLVNIWKIDELRTRILNTLMYLGVYRLGSFVVLPGVDPKKIEAAHQAQSGLLGLLNMFAGGSFGRASVFALGVMPYISASIVVQLLGIVLPSFQKMQKEGESGRKKINQLTRYLTIVITALQAIAFVKTQITPTGAILPGISITLFTIAAMVVLSAGTLFVMWLGEKITDKGIGNGVSLIIMVGIVAQLPSAMFAELASRLTGNSGIIPFIIEIVILVGIIMFTIMIVQGTRKIPVQYAKRIVGNKQVGGVRQYLPLKINAAGVMPIIFAQALMFIPSTVGGLFPNANNSSFMNAFRDVNSWAYNLTFAILIILFTFFYTALTVNTNQIADDMKRNNGFVPGVKPGRETATFIDRIMSLITFPGSVFLAIIAILPSFANILGVSSQFAHFYGGTSLLIAVGVVLDTLQQIESHLLMRHYDGLMKTGRIQGRTSIGATTAV